MDFIFNSQIKAHKDPFGAVEIDTKIILRMKINKDKKPSCRVYIKCNEDIKHIPMDIESTQDSYNIYKAELIAPEKPCLIFYYFVIEIDGKEIYFGNNKRALGGQGELYEKEPVPYQITVHNKNLKVPNWYKEGTMYQILVDRFNKAGEEDLYEGRKGFIKYTNWYDKNKYIKNSKGEIIYWDVYGGNLQGVKEKLKYLKELGVSLIYFNPIFESKSNHKYDTGNYEEIDRGFGGNEAFDDLIKECKKEGIEVILDGVFSHVGDDSKYFNKRGNYDSIGACQSKDSKYYSWFRFKDSLDQYECWWGTNDLPNVNEMEPSYLDYILTGEDSIVKRWIKRGAKGWRLDVADELPDEFIKILKEETKKADAESIVLGEVWEDASNKRSYGELREYLLGDELDSVMNYPYRRIFNNFILGNICSEEVLANMMSLYENYPKEYFYSLMNHIGTHDTVRALTVFGDAPKPRKISEEDAFYFKLSEKKYKLAKKRMKIASFMQAVFPGVPCIYYGDETGKEGFRDPYCRGTYPWGKEDKELLAWYKKIFKYREKSDILKKGIWASYYCQGSIFSIIREYEGKKLLAVINVSFDKKEFKLPENGVREVFEKDEFEGRILLEGLICKLFEIK